MESKKMKEIVKEKYGALALLQDHSSCCASGCCGGVDIYSIMNEDYSRVKGYLADADLGLGCGMPTLFAAIKEGDIVIDLGSGAGNDCFVARAETGESGRVIGIDFSPEMVAKADTNLINNSFRNVEFRLGDIENMPVEASMANVVISNCVLNLLPSKEKIFREIFRVLKPGGHFCVSDIVVTGVLPSAIKEAAEMYVGCIAGAIQKNEYLDFVTRAGFNDVRILKKKKVVIPDHILAGYLDQKEMEMFSLGTVEILSITVKGDKPT